MAFRELHRINQILTLYLQRRQEQFTFGGTNFAGRSLLPILLPPDEYAASNFDERVQPAGTGVIMDPPTSLFLSPQLLRDRLQIKGTGFACIRVSSWTAVAGGTARLTNLLLNLGRWNRNGLVATEFTNRLVFVWDNVNLGETFRSFFFEMSNLDFVLDPAERLVVGVGDAVEAIAQACTFRVPRFTRGLPESYIMLPVIEG